jgi:hypothetical protein
LHTIPSSYQIQHLELINTFNIFRIKHFLIPHIYQHLGFPHDAPDSVVDRISLTEPGRRIFQQELIPLRPHMQDDYFINFRVMFLDLVGHQDMTNCLVDGDVEEVIDLPRLGRQDRAVA